MLTQLGSDRIDVVKRTEIEYGMYFSSHEIKMPIKSRLFRILQIKNILQKYPFISAFETFRSKDEMIYFIKIDGIVISCDCKYCHMIIIIYIHSFVCLNFQWIHLFMIRHHF